jgi:hypothetical protein
LQAIGAQVTCRVNRKLQSLIERVPGVERVLEENEEPAADIVMLAGDLPPALATDPSSALPGGRAAQAGRWRDFPE